MRRLWCVVVFLALLAFVEGQTAEQAEVQKKFDRDKLARELAIEEKIGEYIPLDLKFKDETGRELLLREIVNRPTLILPIFFHCPGTCPIMHAELAMVLEKLGMPKGHEYRAISLSFDEEETPSDAKGAKASYAEIIKGKFPEAEWYFLVGSRENIDKLLAAFGYHFIKFAKHDFIHPNLMMTVAHDGKIIRYLYGPEFLPFDVEMSLLEATAGRASISVRKLLTYCFNYDPKGKKYVVDVTRIFATFTLVTLALVYFTLLRRKKRRQV
ncbi:MAG: SCO family protein [Oligoflexia bacterium]|nr:SCO family protein [Oligoflexia bacterium]